MIKMRAIAVSAICASMMTAALVLGGCATDNSGSVTTAQDENSAVQEATITTRTVTLPAIYFQDQVEDEVRAQLEQSGCTDIEVDEGGAYTFTMPIDKYNQMVDAAYASTKESLDGIPNSESYPSISAIEYDDAFSEVTLTATTDSLGLSEMFVGWAVGLSSNMYQQLAGQPVNCQVTVLGPEGVEIQLGTYPDDFQSAGTAEAH